MKGKYLKRIGGFVLAALMVSGIAFASSSAVQAQRSGGAQGTQGRRVVIVRPYRRYEPFGYDRWGYDRWGFDRFGRDRWGYERFGYDPFSPYGSYYRQYVFRNSDVAVGQGYKDGFKTGKADGKKLKSYDPQRSHYYHDAGFGNFAEVYRSGFSRGYQEGYRVGRAS